MWSVIHVLNSTLVASSLNEGMSHKGPTITYIKTKSNIFVNPYYRVSKLHWFKDEHGLNCLFKKQHELLSANDKSCLLIQMVELLSAVKK